MFGYICFLAFWQQERRFDFLCFFFFLLNRVLGRACVYDDTFLQRRTRFNGIPLKNYSELFCSNSYFFFSHWNIDIVLFSYLAQISVYHILTQMNVGDWAMPSEYFNYSAQWKRCIITRYTLWSLFFFFFNFIVNKAFSNEFAFSFSTVLECLCCSLFRTSTKDSLTWNQKADAFYSPEWVILLFFFLLYFISVNIFWGIV